MGYADTKIEADEAKPVNADERWAAERALNEWGLIGLIIQNAACFRTARAYCGPEDFAEPLMARIFVCAGDLVDAGLDGFKLLSRLTVEFRQDEIIADLQMQPSAIFAKL